MSKQADVLILGAGLAGLTAALHLAERGLRPVVLEAAPRVGGRLAGGEEITVNGATFALEHGVHGIWAQYRNFNAMLARHRLRPVFIPANDETWVYRRHGWIGKALVGKAIRHSIFPAPLHYLQLFLNPRFLWILDIRDWASLFHVWAGLAFGLGIDPFRENQPLEGLTLGGLTRSWSPALKALFQGLARNALAADPDEVPLSGFLGFLRFYTLLRRDAWNFSYLPDDGGTAITGPLARRVEELGGCILLESRVRMLSSPAPQPGDWHVHTENQVFSAPQVILAVESKAASCLISPLLRSCHLPDAFFPRSTANIIIRLWFSAKPKSGSEAGIFSGEFTGHNFFWLDKIYNPFKRWARETGGSAIEVHIYGPPGVLAQPDAVLLTHVLQDVTAVWPELRGARLGQHLQRNPETHTLPAVGPAEKHIGVVSPLPNLFCAGDWVRHPSPSFFLERAVVTGMAAANEVLRAHNQADFPLLEPLPPEPFAGWIERQMVNGRKRRVAARNRKIS